MARPDDRRDGSPAARPGESEKDSGKDSGKVAGKSAGKPAKRLAEPAAGKAAGMAGQNALERAAKAPAEPTPPKDQESSRRAPVGASRPATRPAPASGPAGRKAARKAPEKDVPKAAAEASQNPATKKAQQTAKNTPRSPAEASSGPESAGKSSEKAPSKPSRKSVPGPGRESVPKSGRESFSESAERSAARTAPDGAAGPEDDPEGEPGALPDEAPLGPAPVPARHRAGFVAIIGAPNAGKSSLMNRLLGRKVAIVTAKPQTTRHRVLGVLTGPSGQLVFIDTPGVHRSDKPLNQTMVSRARSAMADADVCLWLVDGAFRGKDHRTALETVLARGSKPLVVAVNKSDLLSPEALADLEAEIAAELPAAGTPGAPAAVLAVSAATGRGLGALRKALLGRLPKSPPLYDDDALTDQTLRDLAAELVREAVFELARQEIPYSTAVTVDSFKEPSPGDPRGLTRIAATVHVERDSQKMVVVGSGGSMIGRIGRMARLGLEDLLGGPVYLRLFVRVTKDWSTDGRMLGELGYSDD